MNYKEFFAIDNKSGKKCRESYLRKNHPDIMDSIIKYSTEHFMSDLPFNEQIWYFINNVKIKTKCLNCGSEVRFRNLNEGYSIFCSSKCGVNHDRTKLKTKQTNLDKYGVDSPMKLNAFKDKIKQTNLDKYGVDSYSKTIEFKDKIKQTNLDKYGVENTFQYEQFKDKTKQTNLDKYGVDSPMKLNVFKDKIKQTNLDKYGVENTFQCEQFKDKIKQTNLDKYGVEYIGSSKFIIEKRKQTNLDKYGVENTFQYEQFKDKTKQTNLDKYGVEYIGNSKFIIEKRKQTSLTNLINQLVNVKFINFEGEKLKFNCVKNHEFLIHRDLIIQRKRFDLDICTICNPIGTHTSQSENKVLKFIEELDISLEKGTRKVIPPLELDMYIPSHNIAIEYDGLYWHSDKFIINDYHLNKTELCEKQGIRLIHIFEDEWVHKQDIVKSRLSNILGLTPNKIYGRKCVIKEVSPKDSKEFLDNNHIQGNVNSSVKLGLYYNDELVSIMTFGGLRKSMGSKSKEGSYELLRFCNKLESTVIGGADKLLKYFIKTHKPIEIISYADRRWSQGGLYDNLGFTFTHNSLPNYYYVIGTKREYRFKYRKDVLVKEGFDPTKTERQIMIDRNIYRIYDCGNKKYVLKLN